MRQSRRQGRCSKPSEANHEITLASVLPDANGYASAAFVAGSKRRGRDLSGFYYRDYSKCLPDYLSTLARAAYEKRNAQLATLTIPAAIRERQRWVRQTFWKPDHAEKSGLARSTPLTHGLTYSLLLGIYNWFGRWLMRIPGRVGQTSRGVCPAAYSEAGSRAAAPHHPDSRRRAPIHASDRGDGPCTPDRLTRPRKPLL